MDNKWSHFTIIDDIAMVERNHINKLLSLLLAFTFGVVFFDIACCWRDTKKTK